MDNYAVKDSGNRREFSTGAVRDMAEGKGRMDLLPFYSLLELSKHMEAGAKKYGDENWRKGIPLRTYLDSAMRHLMKFALGQRDERHDLAAAWNVLCLIETASMIERGILPPDLGNLPDWYNPSSSWFSPDAAEEARIVELGGVPAAELYGYREDGVPHGSAVAEYLDTGRDVTVEGVSFGGHYAFPLDLRPQDYPYPVDPNSPDGESRSDVVRRGHARETAERFTAGKPYDGTPFDSDDYAALEPEGVDELDIRLGELAQWMRDQRAQAASTPEYVEGELLASGWTYDEFANGPAEAVVAAHPLSQVEIIDGDDAPEYEGQEVCHIKPGASGCGWWVPPPVDPNPLDGIAKATLKSTVRDNDERRWEVYSDGRVNYSESFLSPYHSIERHLPLAAVREQVAAGLLSVVSASMRKE